MNKFLQFLKNIVDINLGTVFYKSKHLSCINLGFSYKPTHPTHLF